MKPIEDEVTRRIIKARENMGLNKTEFAAKLGLSKQAYQSYENYATPFSIWQLQMISAITGYPLSYFLGLPTGGLNLSVEEVELLSAFREIKNPDLKRMALRMVRAVANPASVNTEVEDELPHPEASE